MHSSCLAFFPFKFGGGRIFFSFFVGSHCVPTVFPKFPMYSPTCSPQYLTFIPYALANVLLLSPIFWWAKGEELYTSK